MKGDILRQIIKNPHLAKELFKTPDQAFDLLMQKLKMTYAYKTDAIEIDGKPVQESVAVSLIKVQLTHSDPYEIKGMYKDLLHIWKHRQETQFLDRLSARVKYRGEKCDGILKWVRAVTGSVSDLDCAVVAHFIWQVKRKITHSPVEQHMMPVLFGASGGGKSVAVSKLIEPLKDVALSTDMGIFDDTYSKRMLSRNFIVIFDELQGSESVDINIMKQIITASTLEWRVMRTEQVASVPQNATFIGCSNEPVKTRIVDPTSARRFWEFKCLDQIDWDTINGIDYLALWRSVDETGPSPVKELVSSIREQQNQLKSAA